MARKDSFADLEGDLGAGEAPEATKGVRNRSVAQSGRPRSEEPLAKTPIHVRPSQAMAEAFRDYAIDGPEGADRATWKRSNKELLEDAFESLRMLEGELYAAGEIQSPEEVPEKGRELVRKSLKKRK